MAKRARTLSYGSHLQLDKLLACQQRQSAELGRPAHDEMLFIIVHQTYELWFKQILFELDRIEEIFSKSAVDDRDLAVADRGLARIVEIQKLLLQQLDVLETMTPLDFLDFRDTLFPASGFQSLQFRLLETRLGLRRGDRIAFEERPFDSRLARGDRTRLQAAEARPSLFDLVEAWLTRTPFIELPDYDFSAVFRQTVADMLESEAAVIRDNPALDEAQRREDLESLATASARFDSLFDERVHGQLQAEGRWRFSARALQAALFITLYRDEPALNIPFRFLGHLMDIDVGLTNWRQRHALMVLRMIGRKVGTGGSSGHDYLRQTAERHRLFDDLFALSTFLIPRSKLPPLPDELRRALGYRYSGTGA